MGSSSKSAGAGSKSYDIYGDFAVVFGLGPLKSINAIEVDDEVLWTGSLSIDSSPNPVNISIPERGIITLYWGKSDQVTTDSVLTAAGNTLGEDHPAYTNIIYGVAKNFLFGRERYTVPKIRIRGTREPLQTIITGAPAQLEDNQANPLAVMAELMTNPMFGLGFPTSAFATSTWQATAAAIRLKSELYYVSLLLTGQKQIRAIAADFFDLFDGYFRAQESTGICEAGIFPAPETINVASLPVINSDSLEGEPLLTPETWDDIKNRWLVKYKDRDFNFKGRSQKHDSLVGKKRLDGEIRAQTLNAEDYIVRGSQALAFARDRARRKGRPGIAGSLSVRAGYVSTLRPGQHIKVDIDLTPGGIQLHQVFRVRGITRPPKGPAKIDIDAERTLAPVLYTPAVDPGTPPPTPEVPDVVYARFFEVPFGMAGESHNIGVLASRPGELVTDFTAFYDPSPSGTFPQLGDARAYALRARLNGAVTSGATGPFSVELLDTINREMLDTNPGDTAARDDSMLMIVLKIAGSGQIQADGDNKAHIEIFSVSELVSTGTNIVDVSALRSRQGTTAHAFALHDEVWFIRRAALPIIKHADFAGLGTTAGYFKLQPATVDAERPIEDCVLRSFSFALNRDTPGSELGTVKEKRYQRTPFQPATPTGTNPPGWSLTIPSGSDALWETIADLDLGSGLIVSAWSTPVRIEGNIIMFNVGLPSGTFRDGDAFINLADNNKIYRYNSGGWWAAFQPMMKITGGKVSGLQLADGTDDVFVLLASAFQIWNGTSSEAPFEVVGGFTYIKTAIIQNAAIGTLKLATGAVSSTYFTAAGDSNYITNNVFTQVASVSVTTLVGCDVMISCTFAYFDDGPALTADADFEVRRSNGTVLPGCTGWSVKQGNTELISFSLVDAAIGTAWTSYSLHIRPRGGGSSATPSIKATVMSAQVLKR